MLAVKKKKRKKKYILLVSLKNNLDEAVKLTDFQNLDGRKIFIVSCMMKCKVRTKHLYYRLKDDV